MMQMFLFIGTQACFVLPYTLFTMGYRKFRPWWHLYSYRWQQPLITATFAQTIPAFFLFSVTHIFMSFQKLFIFQSRYQPCVWCAKKDDGMGVRQVYPLSLYIYLNFMSFSWHLKGFYMNVDYAWKKSYEYRKKEVKWILIKCMKKIMNHCRMKS